jgi:hypothetical protein
MKISIVSLIKVNMHVLEKDKSDHATSEKERQTQM